MSSCSQEAKFESEMGFNETDGAYAKVKITWEFDNSKKSDSSGESDKTSKGTGETNSADKDDH
jgi:hypothetical protein